MAETRWLDGIILISMLLLSTWISSQFGQLGRYQQETNIANVYGIFALVSLIILGFSGRVAFFEFIGLSGGDSKKRLIYILIGAVAGFLITSQGKSLIFGKMTTGAIDPTLGFLFVLVLAVVVETYFFIGSIYPSFRKFFANRGNPYVAKIIAAAIVCSLFAVWHLYASGGDAGLLWAYFLFAAVMIGLTEGTGSLDAALAAHAALNIING